MPSWSINDNGLKMLTDKENDQHFQALQHKDIDWDASVVDTENMMPESKFMARRY